MNEAQFKLAVVRSEALMNFYSAERRAGADPLLANERLHFFAKRLDALNEQRQSDHSSFESYLAIIRKIMERA